MNWFTNKYQSNKRNGATLTTAYTVSLYQEVKKGIRNDTLRLRLKRGWSIAKALETPARKKKV